MNLILSWRVGDEERGSVPQKSRDTDPGMWYRAWPASPGEGMSVSGLVHESLGDYKLICYKLCGPGGRIPSEAC